MATVAPMPFERAWRLACEARAQGDRAGHAHWLALAKRLA